MAFGQLLTAGILFAVALAFLAAELFVPSHGILAAFCAVFAVGVIAAYMAQPMVGIISAIFIMGAAPVAFYWAVKLYPQTVVGKRVLLRRPEPSKTAGFDKEAGRLAELTGKRGVAISPLRPAGVVEIEGRRIDCLSESTVIDAGATVEVVRVMGLKVIVKGVG